MGRKVEPMTAEEIAAVAQRADEFSYELDAAMARMAARHTDDLGDAIEVLRCLARCAESAMALSRYVVGSAKMRDQMRETEARIKAAAQTE